MSAPVGEPADVLVTPGSPRNTLTSSKSVMYGALMLTRKLSTKAKNKRMTPGAQRIFVTSLRRQ